MNNLHRELAPISDGAWAQIEEEAQRTLKRYLAGRRVVDVKGPGGCMLSAVGTGHLNNLEAPGAGIIARQREVKALVELRVPFQLERQAIDDVERGANDSDWQPLKDAAKRIAFCRRPRDLRRLRRGRNRRHPAGHQQQNRGVARRPVSLPRRDRRGAEPVAAGRRQRAVFGGDGRRRVHGAERGERSRLSGHPAHPAAGQRGDHLRSRDCRSVRADDARRRLRTASRPGRLDRLSEPRRQDRKPVPAGNDDLPAADVGSRGRAETASRK